MILARRRSLLSLFVLLPALACSQAPPAKNAPTPEATRAARSTDLRDTQALLLLMADQKRYEETVFIALLDSSHSVRRDLAVALGRIGDPRGRGLLQGLLIDSEADVRRAAAFSLGELGIPEAVPALLRASVDDDSETGALAVEALSKLAAPLADVRRTLTALEPEVAAPRLAPYLFRFKEDGVVDVAIEWLRSADREVRAGAAYALGREARPAALGELRLLIADNDAQIRAWAARGLGEVGDLSDLSALEVLLADSAPSPCIQALRSGARIVARSQAVPPLSWGHRLGTLIDDSRPGVRAMALESSQGWMPQPEVHDAVIRRLGSGEPREREIALLALAGAEDPSAEDEVRRAAKSPAKLLRARAAEAAGALGLDDLVEVLAKDPEAVVRVAAVESMMTAAAEPAIGRSAAAAVPPVPAPAPAGGGARARVAALARRFLGDADPVVRATVLEALVETPELPRAEIVGALASAAADTMLDARLSAVRARAARARIVPGERAETVATLERLTSDDREYLVRREALAALRTLGGEPTPLGPAATGRTGPVYSEILLRTNRPHVVELKTARGSFRIRLDCAQAPLTCLSFLQLAAQGYFDGLSFHRVVPDFVVQTGDPRGDGWGGPGFTLRDEINPRRFVRGAVGMALSGPDTGGSQFFIALSPQPHLDGGYTVFGQVEGDDAVLDQIRQEDGLLSVREVDTGE
ncbi:MAG: peptidylprolyl isomerase [Thermoanaerobaculia bacterium]